MKLLLILLLLPAMASAQNFEPRPDLGQDGIAFDVDLVDGCVIDLLTEGVAALVADKARNCVGQSATPCAQTQDAVACTVLERDYWDWRLTQSFAGLALWAEEEASPALRDTLLPLYRSPAMATGHLTLECDIRVNRVAQSQTPDIDEAQCLLTETALMALEAEFALRGACARGSEGAFGNFCEGDMQ